MRTQESGKRAFSLWQPLRALALASAVALVSCGGGGDSDGTLCQQCGDDPDGPCLATQSLDGEPPAAVLCTNGQSCTVQLFCLRKLGSSQRRCFPAREGTDAADPSFECDGARPNTEVRVCGNGTIESGEQCDDDNTTPGDGCDAECQVEPDCGNDEVEAGEDCDDGGESETCNEDCTTAECGDGKLNETAEEQCDGNDLGDADCAFFCDKINPAQDVTGDLRCNATMCTFEFGSCVNAINCEVP